MKFTHETSFASGMPCTSEYNAQFEYTPDTEEKDGSCRSYMTYIAFKSKCRCNVFFENIRRSYHRRPKLTIRKIDRRNDLCKRMNDSCERMNDLCKRIEWDVTT